MMDKIMHWMVTRFGKRLTFVIVTIGNIVYLVGAIAIIIAAPYVAGRFTTPSIPTDAGIDYGNCLVCAQYLRGLVLIALVMSAQFILWILVFEPLKAHIDMAWYQMNKQYPDRKELED